MNKPSEHPILMSGPRVREILDGLKTQTRRAIRPQPPECILGSHLLATDVASPSGYSLVSDEYGAIQLKCPYGKPGDRLWVRETIYYNLEHDNFYFAADRKGCGNEIYQRLKKKTHPSIHMPRWASRITLEVMSVRVERIQDISVDDIKAEIGEKTIVDQLPAFPAPIPKGVDPEEHLDKIFRIVARRLFKDVWNGINAKRGLGWDENPYCWIIEFKVI